MRPILFPALACLMACQTAPDSAGPSGDCGAAGLQDLVGAPLAALPEEGPWATLRIIRPGDAVTQDYSESRLNVSLDAADRILALTCG